MQSRGITALGDGLDTLLESLNNTRDYQYQPMVMLIIIIIIVVHRIDDLSTDKVLSTVPTFFGFVQH